MRLRPNIFISQSGELMKHRRNKVKREHGIIQDALGWLEELSQCPQVSDIIPGVIEVSRSPERGAVYKYETQTGCKILLKSNGSVQEAFVVTQDPDVVRRWIETRFPSESKPPSDEQEKNNGGNQSSDGVKRPSRGVKQPASREKRSTKKKETPKTPLSKNRQLKNTTIHQKEIENRYLRNDDFEGNLGQRINAKTLHALKALQKDISSKTTRKKN